MAMRRKSLLTTADKKQRGREGARSKEKGSPQQSRDHTKSLSKSSESGPPMALRKAPLYLEAKGIQNKMGQLDVDWKEAQLKIREQIREVMEPIDKRSV